VGRKLEDQLEVVLFVPLLTDRGGAESGGGRELT
jgi:hypothetical protein